MPMKWRMRLRYAVGSIRKRYGMFLLNFVIIALCFYITDTLVTDYIHKEKSETMQLDMLQYEPERTGKLLFNSGITLDAYDEMLEYQEGIRSVLEQIEAMEEIEKFGSFRYTSGESQDLARCAGMLQWYEERNQRKLEAETMDVSVLQLYGDAVHLGKLELQQGNIETFFQPGEEVKQVLVGADFAEILKVGDQFYMQTYADSTEHLYQVAGVLKQSSHWFGENAFFLRGLQTLDSAMVIADSQAIPEISGEMSTPGAEYYFCLKEGCDQEDALENIQTMFREKAVVGRSGMVMALLDEMMDTMRESLKKQMQFCAAVLGVAFLFLTVYLVIQVWERKKEFGIICACGMERRDLVAILCAEEIMTSVFAWIFIYIWRWLEVYKNTKGPYMPGDPQESFSWMMREVHSRETLFITWILLLGIGVATWIIIKVVLRKKEIVNLLR